MSTPYTKDESFVTMDLPATVVSDLIVSLSEEVEKLKGINENLRTDLSTALRAQFPRKLDTSWSASKYDPNRKPYKPTKRTNTLTPKGRKGMQFAGYVKNLPQNVQTEARAIKRTQGVTAALKYVKNWKNNTTPTGTTTEPHENYGQ